MNRALLLTLLLLSTINSSFAGGPALGTDSIIYFDPEVPIGLQFNNGDDRIFLEQANEFKENQVLNKLDLEYLPKVVGAITLKRNLIELTMEEDGEEGFILPSKTIGRRQNLCEDEDITSEISAVDCTAFLIGPDLVATAGHCIRSDFSCRNKKIIFNQLNLADTISSEDIYQCEEILDHAEMQTFFEKKDFSIIRLDREVSGVMPLAIDYSKPSKGSPVYMVGHSEGMKLSISTKGKIMPPPFLGVKDYIGRILHSRFYFTTTLDSFIGNSGSPIFNLNTGDVSGILFDGGTDYIDFEVDENRKCKKRNRVAATKENAAELGFRLSQIKELKVLIEQSFDRHGRDEQTRGTLKQGSDASL